MKLSELIPAEECRSPEILLKHDPEITNLTADSRQISPSSLFFSIRGAKIDATTFINESFEKGAAAAVYDGELTTSPNGLAIQVNDVRKALSIAAHKFFGEPSSKTTNIAITGTSGKTSVAWIISHSLNAHAGSTFLGGTLGYKLLEQNKREAAQGMKELGNTSIDPISVHSLLLEAVNNGAQYSVFESTSQGIAQSRMRDVQWNGAIFTNITREHMDLHGTMEKYEAAKRQLFFDDLIISSKKNKFAIFNFDDPAAVRIGLELKGSHPEIKVVTFSKKSGAEIDYQIIDLKADTAGLSFRLKNNFGDISLNSSLVGDHNAYNITCAALALKQLNISNENISQAISSVPAVPGRLEAVRINNRQNYPAIFVDYAHKPDALEKVLTFIKPLAKGRLISVFGCGGDRDKGKRPIMGEISRRIADVTVVTSDNPRTENPLAIVNEIVSGINDKENYSLIIETDRKKAIAEAIRISKPDDIIVIAGKGHEPYQEIQGVKHPFNDANIAQEILAKS